MPRELPLRPRLSDRVLVRRHAGDADWVVLHDQASRHVMRILPVQWRVLALADGTRDVEGVALAARARGIETDPAHLAAFLAHLAEKELLADGPLDSEDAAADPDADLLDVPVEAIEGWTLTCSGRGICCEVFPTVLFREPEARRALVLLEDEAHDFYPQHGIAREGGLVTPVSVHGRCRYLSPERRCALHAEGGAEAKPRACRGFPLQSVFDGEAVRAGFSFECACVIDGIGDTGGQPPVPDGARRVADLPRFTPVGRLPERTLLAGSSVASRDEVRRFYRALSASAAPSDVAAGLWAVGEALEQDGIARAAAAYLEPPKLDPAAPIALCRELAESVDAWRAPFSTFRSERDLTRAALDWIVNAAERIASTGLPPAPPPSSREAEVEAFYVVATSWSYADALRALPLAVAFRVRAQRVWLARAIAASPPDDRRAGAPLSVVEVVFRAVGLDSFAAEDSPA